MGIIKKDPSMAVTMYAVSLVAKASARTMADRYKYLVLPLERYFHKHITRASVQTAISMSLRANLLKYKRVGDRARLKLVISDPILPRWHLRKNGRHTSIVPAVA